MLCVCTAPTAPPTAIMTTPTPNSITVQWGPVECIHGNGDITGYTVRVMRSGENDRIVNITGGDVREATVSGLSQSTEYTVSVAAVNNVGTGVYSDGTTLETSGKYVNSSVFLISSDIQFKCAFYHNLSLIFQRLYQ